jgi:hypothetical protein
VDDAVLGRELDAQVLDRKQRLGLGADRGVHAAWVPSLIRGSR